MNYWNNKKVTKEKDKEPIVKLSGKQPTPTPHSSITRPLFVAWKSHSPYTDVGSSLALLRTQSIPSYFKSGD